MDLTVGKVAVSCVDGVVSWTSGLAVDADGSPRAYSPDGSALRGLDYLANAGKPGQWWGLACDENGKPYIQDHEDPCPGYYVSTTSLVDASKQTRDPKRYVNSEAVCYLAVPKTLLKTCGVKLGDLALVERRDTTVGAIVADIGPAGHIGEGSIALARALGIPDSPRNGGVSSGVKFTIFAGSATRPPWPRMALTSSAELLAKQKLRTS